MTYLEGRRGPFRPGGRHGDVLTLLRVSLIFPVISGTSVTVERSGIRSTTNYRPSRRVEGLSKRTVTSEEKGTPQEKQGRVPLVPKVLGDFPERIDENDDGPDPTYRCIRKTRFQSNGLIITERG